jgi:hypothetical protein
LAKHLYLFGGCVDGGAQKQKRIANISYTYVVGWSANLKWENLESATLLCRWVSALLEMGNFRVCNISMYGGVSANLRWGNLGFATFYVYGWVQTANLKWETLDFQHFVCVCCVCVCLLPTSNLKWEI